MHRAETSEHRGKKPIATGKVPGILKPVGFRPGSYSRAFEPFGKQAQREFDAAGADLRMQIKLGPKEYSRTRFILANAAPEAPASSERLDRHVSLLRVNS